MVRKFFALDDPTVSTEEAKNKSNTKKVGVAIGLLMIALPIVFFPLLLFIFPALPFAFLSYTGIIIILVYFLTAVFLIFTSIK